MLRRRSDTRDLSNHDVVLVSERSQGRPWRTLLVLALIVGAGYFGLDYFERHLAPAVRIGELERENAELREKLEKENAQLRDELELQRMNLSVEQAARAELEKEIGERTAELKRLSDELIFIKNAKK